MGPNFFQHFSIQNTPNKNVAEAERINPFPTKHLDKYQFVNMLTKADKLIQDKP